MNYTAEMPELQDGSPWGRDRIELERYAICSSWSRVESARDLLTFPSAAWMREDHRLIVDAIRSLLLEGVEINDIAVGMRLQELHPRAMSSYREIHNLYAHNLVGIDSLQPYAIKRLREEYDWQTAYYVTSEMARKMRSMPFADWFREIQAKLTSLAPSSGADEVKSFDQIYLERIDQHLNKTVEEGSSTQIKALDRALGGGLKPGWMVLVVGAPGTGKTVLAFQLALNQSANDVGVAFFQLEMSAEEMADRAISMTTGREISNLSKDDLKAARVNAKYLRSLHLYDAGYSLEQWEAEVDRHVYRHGNTSTIVTDYAGLLQQHSARVNTVNAANEVSAAGKRIAKRHGVAHIMLQQPNRGYDNDKRPSLAHIRDSGKFEQDSHVILFIHYPHKFDKSIPENYTQLHVLKNRGGRSGEIIHLEWTPGAYTMRQWTGDLPIPGGSQDVAQRFRAKNDLEILDDWTNQL